MRICVRIFIDVITSKLQNITNTLKYGDSKLTQLIIKNVILSFVFLFCILLGFIISGIFGIGSIAPFTSSIGITSILFMYKIYNIAYYYFCGKCHNYFTVRLDL